ncbi:MAG: hypothetical protein ABSE73_01590 [Planctomycetota bacterium]
MTHQLSVVSGDPGGVNALAPVVLALQADNRYRVHVFGYRQAPLLWRKRGLACGELPITLSLAEAQQRLAALAADLLLTGTSTNELNLEKTFIAAAKTTGVPSLAVLDFWSNYHSRFGDSDGRLSFQPERIAVPDEHARDEMIAEGFDASKLRITGQPAFDELAACLAGFTLERHAQIRKSWEIQESELVVVFASQSLESFYGNQPGVTGYPGYTEHSVLQALIPALEQIAASSGRKIRLVIRPHPLENPAPLARHGSNIVRVRVDGGYTGREAVLAADLVVGMSTVLLLEAALLKCVVVSLQPGLLGKDMLPSNSRGLTTSVYRHEDIRPTVQRLLLDESARAEVTRRTSSITQSGSTKRVLGLLEELLRQAPLRIGAPQT